MIFEIDGVPYVNADCIRASPEPEQSEWYEWREKLQNEWYGWTEGKRTKVLAKLLVFQVRFCRWLVSAYVEDGCADLEGPEDALLPWVYRSCAERQLLWEATRGQAC